MTTHTGREASLTGRRVLVLGAGGFIGSWMCRRLAEGGAHATLAVRPSGGDGDGDAKRASGMTLAGGMSAGIAAGETVSIDLIEPGAVDRLVRETRPEVIFNLVGYGVDRTERDPAFAQRLNADLVAELAKAAERLTAGDWAGQHLVHVGSALEYGGVDGDLDEAGPVRPNNSYGRTKLAGTQAVLDAVAAERGVRGVVARLFTVYGPGEHAGRLLPSIIEAARSGSCLELTSGVQRRDFTYVGDVAEGLWRLASVREPIPTAVNLATGSLTSVREFALAASSAAGLPTERLAFGSLPTREEEMQHGPVSIARLQRYTEWRPPTGVVEGIRRTLAELAAFGREGGQQRQRRVSDAR